MWALASYDTGTMIGYHAVPVIADAYAKGFRGFDANLALTAMRATAMDSRNRQDEYTKQGYVSSETGKGCGGTARTLEFAFDDWCIGQMAAALGRPKTRALFNQRAQKFYKRF